jgi:hypothetical protein
MPFLAGRCQKIFTLGVKPVRDKFFRLNPFVRIMMQTIEIDVKLSSRLDLVFSNLLGFCQLMRKREVEGRVNSRRFIKAGTKIC